MLRAIIFDFDGVLADSEVFHCAAFEAVAAAAGLPFSRAAYFKCFLGLPDPECFAALYTEAADGRPVFVLPWNEQILVGTTEVPDTGDPGRTALPSVARVDRVGEDEGTAEVAPAIRRRYLRPDRFPAHHVHR